MPWLSFIVSNLLLASILAIAAWLIQHRLRMHGIAHVIWVLALVKLLTPPWSFPSAQESAFKSPCENGVCGCGPHWQLIAIDVLPKALVSIWCLGALGAAWIAWSRWAGFRRLVADAQPAPFQWRAMGARLSAKLSIRRTPEILATSACLPPMIVPGWRGARMLLPLEMIGSLTPPQRTALMLHELTHVKRRDHLVRMLELVARVVYWWLPLLPWICRNLRACEEACCDAAVVAKQPKERRDYARLLLDVLDFTAPVGRSSIHATAMNSADDVERRLRAILDDGNERPRGNRTAGIVAVALACCVIPCEMKCDVHRWIAPSAASPMTGSAELIEGCEARVALKTHCCPS